MVVSRELASEFACDSESMFTRSCMYFSDVVVNVSSVTANEDDEIT